MEDTVTSITHESFGSRIVNSWKGLLAAPILLILGTSVLVWNESNSISQQKALSEGLKAVITVNTVEINPNFEGKLVHFIGKAIATDEVEDSTFGVTPPLGTLKLKRDVEMYQWVEESHSEKKKNLGGSTDTITRYTYSQQWENHLIDSSFFHDSTFHENPSRMKFDDEVFEAQSISVGAYQLSTAIKEKISWYKDFDLVKNNITTETTKDAIIHDKSFYFGDNNNNNPVTNPSVGDTRVSFEEIPQQTISIIAKQVGDSLSKYTTSNGKYVLLVESGTHDAVEMFENAQQALKVQTWSFRIGGAVFIFFAFHAIMEPLTVLADCIPFVGDILETGNCCISFFLSFAFSTVVIAISWLAFRPLFSILLFTGAGAAIYAAKRYKRNKNRGYEDPGDAAAALPEAQAFVIPSDQQYNKDAELG